jgi:hypothetical protein
LATSGPRVGLEELADPQFSNIKQTQQPGGDFCSAGILPAGFQQWRTGGSLPAGRQRYKSPEPALSNAETAIWARESSARTDTRKSVTMPVRMEARDEQFLKLKYGKRN